MADSLDRACRRYVRAAKQGRLPVRGDGDVADQVEQYRAAMMRERWLVDSTRAVLAECRITRATELPYLNFARRVDKLVRKYSEQTLANEVRRAAELWVLNGARREVLVQILRRVFELELKRP